MYKNAPSLKLDHQKAIVANQIINMITSKPNQNLLQNSLRDEILTMIQKKQGINLQVKQEFTNFFVEGIQPDKQIFAQERVDKSKPQIDKKIVFCPTHLVTGEIFDMIKRKKYQERFYYNNIGMYGHFGIAKTFSLMLYSHLSKYVTEYVISNKLNKKQRQQFIVSKLVYWMIPQSKSFKSKEIYKNLLKQIHQFKQVTLDDLASDELKSKYNSFQINFILVVDQIHTLTIGAAYNMKKFEEFKQQSKKVQLLANKKQLMQKLQNEIIVRQLYLHTIKNISYNFNFIIESSSIHLQKSILKQLAQGRHARQVTSELMVVPYIKKITDEYSRYELIDYFIFELGNRIKINILQPNWHLNFNQESLKYKQQLRNHLYSQLKTENIFFLSPLFIRAMYVPTQQIKPLMFSALTIQKILNIQTKQDLKHQLSFLLDQTIISAHNWFKDKLKTFIQKDLSSNQIRLYLVRQFYNKSIKMNKQNQENQIPELLFSQIPYVKDQIIKFVQQQYLDTNNKVQFLDRIIFDIDYDNRIIRLYFNAKLTQKMFAHISQNKFRWGQK